MAAMAAVRRSPFLMTYSSTHGPLAPDDCHVHVAYLNALDISQVPTWGTSVPLWDDGTCEPQAGTWRMSRALRYATWTWQSSGANGPRVGELLTREVERRTGGQGAIGGH